MPVFRIMKNTNYTVMSNYHLRDTRLSLKAVGLLSKMLSLAEEWNYTNRGLAKICKEGVDAVGSALRELEHAGYLERRQLRSESGKIQDTEYIIYEIPQQKERINETTTEPENHEFTSIPTHEGKNIVSSENKDGQRIPYPVRPYTENPDTATSDTKSTAQLNKDRYNTNRSSINLSSSERSERMDYETAVCLLRDNIEYDVLLERYPKSKVNLVVEIGAEIMCSPSEQIIIGREQYPYEIARNRILQLNFECVMYVFESMADAGTDIRCIKPYLTKALLNAPITMDCDISEKIYRALRQ